MPQIGRRLRYLLIFVENFGRFTLVLCPCLELFNVGPSMGWRGTLRGIQASERHAEREAQRRHRELQRFEKELEKLSAIEQARHEVESYENRIEILLSIHKEQAREWDWKLVEQQPPPLEPVRTGERGAAARAEAEAYKPTLLEKMFGGARKKEEALALELHQAITQDEQEFQSAWEQYQKDLIQCEEERRLATAVLAGDQEAYVKVVREFSPFHEISELGSSVSFRIHSPKLVEVLLSVKGEEAIPSEVKTLSASGKVSRKAMPKARFQEIYHDYMAGCVLRVARETFGLLPVDTVIVTASADLFDSSTGRSADQPIISLALDRTTLCQLNFSRLDPSDAIQGLFHRGDFKVSRKTGAFAPIQPLTPDDLAQPKTAPIKGSQGDSSPICNPAPVTAPPENTTADTRSEALQMIDGCIASMQRASTEDLTECEPSKNSEKVSSAIAYPESLVAPRENPIAIKWAEALRQNKISSGFLKMTANELAVVLGYVAQDNFSLAESKALARQVEDFGYCLEPDARHGGGNFWGTRELGLFQPPTGTLSSPSESFLGASALLQLCLVVAAADGTVDRNELDQFRKFIDSHFQFNPDESQRLTVLEQLLARNAAPAKVTLGRTAKRIPREKHLTVGQFLVDVAASDGVISPKEHKALLRIFEALGLDTQNLDGLIKVAAGGDETIIEPAAAAPSTQSPKSEPRFKLDMSRVASISAETNEVMGLLAKAMMEEAEATQEAQQIPAPPAAPTAECNNSSVASRFTGLDPKYHAIAERLFVKDQWSQDELATLAREHHLMVLSVIDTLNEWAEESFGDFIIQGDDPIIIQSSILKTRV